MEKKVQLLTVGNPKTLKGQGLRYLTAILHLAPHRLSGVMNACPYATEGCIGGCLNKAGRGGIFRKGEDTNAIQKARIARTRWLAADRAGFLAHLHKEIKAHVRRAYRAEMVPAIRPNGTSDIAWERVAPELFDRWNLVRWYDYTKGAHRLGQTPPNYSLTLSRSESNEAECLRALANGHNVAAVFAGDLPATHHGFPVINADEHDLRFLDPRGVWCGLRAKGPARRDASGFVIR